MVIIGSGIEPATGFLSRTESGIKLDDQGAVLCDPFLQTNKKDIWAAGDVASFPQWSTGKQTRIEHWINASDQGSFVAFNMLEKYIPHDQFRIWIFQRFQNLFVNQLRILRQ